MDVRATTASHAASRPTRPEDKPNPKGADSPYSTRDAVRCRTDGALYHPKSKASGHEPAGARVYAGGGRVPLSPMRRLMVGSVARFLTGLVRLRRWRVRSEPTVGNGASLTRGHRG